MKTLRNALRSEELTLTAELSLVPRRNAHEILEQARILAESTDAIQVPDSRNARPHMSNIAVASLLTQDGMDPIVHFNSRDRNRIAFQSDLLGAQGIGVSNLLLMRGASLPPDHQPRTTGVFDVSAVDMISTAVAIRDGEALAGGQLPDAPDFFIGSVGTIFDANSDWEPEKLIEKAEAGARFIQMQHCFDMDVLREYMKRLVAAKLIWKFHVLINLAVFPSADAARQLRQAQPDAIIPAEVVRRIESARDPESEGVKVCAELLQELAEIPGIAGANLVTPGEPETITAAIRESGLRANT